MTARFIITALLILAAALWLAAGEKDGRGEPEK